MTEGMIKHVLDGLMKDVERSANSNLQQHLIKSWLTVFANDLTTELKVYCMDREQYNTGLHRYLFGDSE